MVLNFSTRTAPIVVHFQVSPEVRKLAFRTNAGMRVVHFQVEQERRKLRFTTSTRFRTVRFRVGNPPPRLLQATLSEDGRCLLATLSNEVAPGKYTLSAARYGSTETKIPCPVSGALRQWKLPVGEDGIWELRVEESSLGTVAEVAVLVNQQSLRRLSRYAKKAKRCHDPYFEELCYYNGMVIMLYQVGNFNGCQQMLTLLQDVATC